MESFQKKLLSFAVVAFVSSAVSVGAYALIKKEASSSMTDMDVVGTEQSVSGNFVRVSNVAPQTIDFTQIAEKSVNAVVSIKSTITPKQSSSRQFRSSNSFSAPANRYPPRSSNRV